jgi:hypothetical protein
VVFVLSLENHESQHSDGVTNKPELIQKIFFHLAHDCFGAFILANKLNKELKAGRPELDLVWRDQKEVPTPK